MGLMLKVEKAERRLHEIVVAEVAVLLDEIVAAVVRSVTFACVRGSRHSYTLKQKGEREGMKIHVIPRKNLL